VAWTVGTVEEVGWPTAAGVLAGALDCAADWGPAGAALWGVLAAALGETVCGFFLALKYCRPKKTVTRMSIMTRRDLLSPPPC
jgi:hypothetical protein